MSNSPLYLELEVVSPIVELAANGGRYTFTEDWYAAKLQGPVLSVNSSGAVEEHLKIQNGKITGRFGIFHTGTARLSYTDGNGNELGSGSAWPVTPLETFVLDETDTIPSNTAVVELMTYDPSGHMNGIVDLALAGPTVMTLPQNFPNPFKAATTLQCSVPEDGDADLSIFDTRGRKMAVLLTGAVQAGYREVMWHAEGMASGIYIARLKFKGSTRTIKMVLAR